MALAGCFPVGPHYRNAVYRGSFADPFVLRVGRSFVAYGTNVGQMCGISTFSEYTTVAVDSAIKVPQDTKLEVACLLGCSVGTGWGTAVNTGEVQPGDTVIIQGIGGIGANAVQGAAHAGATHVLAVPRVRISRTRRSTDTRR